MGTVEELKHKPEVQITTFRPEPETPSFLKPNNIRTRPQSFEVEEEEKTTTWSPNSSTQIDERLERMYAKIQLEKVKPYREKGVMEK